MKAIGNGWKNPDPFTRRLWIIGLMFVLAGGWMSNFRNPSNWEWLGFGALVVGVLAIELLSREFETVLHNIEVASNENQEKTQERIGVLRNGIAEDLELKFNEMSREIQRSGTQQGASAEERTREELTALREELRRLRENLEGKFNEMEAAALIPELAVSKQNLDGTSDEIDEDLRFSIPREYWGNGRFRVNPAKRQYTRTAFHYQDWPNPDGSRKDTHYFSLHEYDVRPESMQVFVRMIDDGRTDDWEMRDERTDATTYDIVNGTVLNQDDPGLGRDIFWHELTRPEKYFILSADAARQEPSREQGRCKHFFANEKTRIEKGLAGINAEAETQGVSPAHLMSPEVLKRDAQGYLATGKPPHYSAAVRYRISSDEHSCSEAFLYVLNALLKGEQPKT